MVVGGKTTDIFVFMNPVQVRICCPSTVAMAFSRSCRFYTYVYIALFVLACFLTLIALRRPHGAQPAAYGHLQTLANLVDGLPSPGPSIPESEPDGELELEKDKRI
jgi:hypothetical protein